MSLQRLLYSPSHAQSMGFALNAYHRKLSMASLEHQLIINDSWAQGSSEMAWIASTLLRKVMAETRKHKRGVASGGWGVYPTGDVQSKNGNWLRMSGVRCTYVLAPAPVHHFHLCLICITSVCCVRCRNDGSSSAASRRAFGPCSISWTQVTMIAGSTTTRTRHGRLSPRSPRWRAWRGG